MTPHDFSKFVSPIVLSNKNFNKIFCIGYNKTGTTSLQAILQSYGYQLPNQIEQEIVLSKPVFSTDYLKLKSFCESYDAFQDMPFSQGLTYVVADALFPSSKFILTERPADDWYNSICNYHKKRFGIDDLSGLTEIDLIEKFIYLYPGYFHLNKERLLSSFSDDTRTVHWEKLYDYEYYTDMYIRRNEEIKRYFMNTRDKLLVIDLTKEKNTMRICEFLNIPLEYSIDVPHYNKT